MQKNKKKNAALSVIFVRFTIIGILLYLIYGEAGPWTAIACLLMYAAHENAAYHIHKHANVINRLAARENQRIKKEVLEKASPMSKTLN